MLSLPHARKLVAVTGIASTVMFIPGCANAPTPEQIETKYNTGVRLITEAYNRMVAGCRQNYPDGSTEQTSCLQKADEWRMNQEALALASRDDAYNENWASARRRKEQLEKELQNMLPNWPEIRDLITIIDNGSASGTGTPTGTPRYVADVNPNFSGTIEVELIPVPIELQTYSFSGQMQFDWSDMTVSAPFSGSLEMRGTRTGSEYSGVIHSGTLEATFAGGVQARLVIIGSSSNIISTDATGNGQMVFLAEFEHDLESWESIVFSRHRVLVPIQMNSQGVITINTTSEEVESMLPYAPRPYTDYNLDGVYDFQSDFNAFLADFSQQHIATDINVDRVWNQADIDRWVTEFNEDEAGMNP